MIFFRNIRYPIAVMGGMLLLALVGLIGCAGSEATVWYNKGVGYDHVQPGAGIKYYTKAIALKPDFYEAYNNRAKGFIVKSDFKKAVSDLEKAIDIDPDFFVAYYNKGHAYHLLGQRDLAIRDYSEAIRLNPDYGHTYVNRGNAYSETGRYEKAITDKTTGIALLRKKNSSNNELAIAYSSRAITYFKKGEFELAIADENSALELNPSDAKTFNQTYNLLAWLLATTPDAALRDGKKALKMAKKLVDVHPDAKHLDTLAAAFAEVGMYKKAIDTQVKAIDALTLEDAEKLTTEFEEFEKHLMQCKSHKPWRIIE